MDARFKVVKGSESHHCCFEATVVDTTRDSHGQPATAESFRNWIICECFEENDAQAICNALNAAELNKETACTSPA